VAEAASGPAAVAESPVRVAPAGTPRQLCPYCHAPRSSSDSYCGNCGWVFSAEETVFLGPASANSPGAGEQIQGRYELGALVNERQGVARFRGLDRSTDVKPPLPVVILRSRRDELPPAAQAPAPAQSDSDDGDVLPDFEEPMAATVPMSQIGISPNLIWPTLLWEEAILRKAEHSALPRVLESFSEGEFDYLVEESLLGRSLWDAWDDPAVSVDQRFMWLKEVAEALHSLHRAGPILEGLRPDIVAITRDGHAVLTHVSGLPPLPFPGDPPTRATPHPAPGCVLASDQADARADLYSFGATLYALHLGRELTEMDFESQQGVPKPIIPTFPDVHPLFARLVS